MFAAAGAVVAIVLEAHINERQRSKYTHTHTHLLCRLIDMYRCMALSFTLLFCDNSLSV